MISKWERKPYCEPNTSNGTHIQEIEKEKGGTGSLKLLKDWNSESIVERNMQAREPVEDT